MALATAPHRKHQPQKRATLACSFSLPPARREGYEEGISTTHKVLPAAAFIAGDSPVEMLGQYTAIAIEGPNSEGERASERLLRRTPFCCAVLRCSCSWCALGRGPGPSMRTPCRLPLLPKSLPPLPLPLPLLLCTLLPLLHVGCTATGGEMPKTNQTQQA